MIVAIFLDRSIRYTQNGILHMLDRNRRIKPKPERFQACHDEFDVVVSCEERVYDQVIEGKVGKALAERGYKAVSVICDCFFGTRPCL